jgi:TonB family protein
MYLDLEDYRPDTPRVTSVISVREGILISLLIHALMVIGWLVMPPAASSTALALVPPPQDETVQFVHMTPRVETKAVPPPRAEQSDLDRRAAAPEQAPKPDNTMPFSRGNTPEKMVGAPNEKAAGPDAPPAPPTSTPPPPDNATRIAAPETPPLSVPKPAGGSLGNQLRNLQQFLSDQNFDNQTGRQADQNADIDFDSKGVEFGPWLRRFVAQVKRNWYVPQAAMFQKGHVVIQFYVLKNGTITDIKIVQLSGVPSFDTSAFNSLKNSNPTQPLPPEYPDDRAFFTVTFHYNEPVGRGGL